MGGFARRFLPFAAVMTVSNKQMDGRPHGNLRPVKAVDVWFNYTDLPFFKCFRSKRNASLHVVCYTTNQTVLLHLAYSSIVMAYALMETSHCQWRHSS